MKKILILGAGLSGRIAKYIFGDSAILLGKLQENIQPFFYVHEFLDKKLTHEKVKISKSIIGLKRDKKNLQELEKAYLAKTGRVGAKKTSFREENINGWLLDETVLPKPDVQGWVRSVDLDGKKVWLSEKVFQSFDVLINTVPLPKFLELAGLTTPKGRFKHFRIGLKQMPCYKCEKILVDFFPKQATHYRSTIWKGKEVLEFSEASMGKKFGRMEFGQILDPGKILPEFLVGVQLVGLETFNVYCLGRYACWEPRMMVHDVFRRAKELNVKSSSVTQSRTVL